jgi:uncharacterized protein YijF (DUF1287 family)
MKNLLLLFLLHVIISPEKDFYEKLSDAAISVTKDNVEYDGRYYQIKYPGGDVPKGKGVCTDVVIRSYRKLGIDLQKEVHEDMKANFAKYPKSWRLKTTDTNIDHRRVPNLQVFFSRKGQSLPITNTAAEYKPGDIVTWMLPANLPHIGLVVNRKSGSRYMVVHNEGYGQVLDDCLFRYKITGHFRYKK